MATNALNVTSFDHDSLKTSLIDFLRSTGDFDDFNFEGSTLNTIIDLMVRNAHMDAYLANMLANESFIDSAQLRSNVVSHAQKLSYTPRSRTASRALVDIFVTPSDTNGLTKNITMPSGTVFLSSVGGETYTFVANETIIMPLNEGTNKYEANDVTIYQGQRVTNSFVHSTNGVLEIPNSNIDTSTITVSSLEGGVSYSFEKAESISEIAIRKDFYFLSENNKGKYQIEFGKGFMSREPADGSAITISYINTEENHANGASSFIAGSTIEGYSNIQISTTTKAYGGYDREDIEKVRFTAPKFYQTQDRGVVETDYSILAKKQFPFINSIKVWGGEKNEPKVYGTVFMSIISDEGTALTRTAKNDIVNYLTDYNIGSITPEIVDAEGIGINLDIKFAFDSKKTSKSFNTLSTDLLSVVNSYNENDINQFEKYYNDSKLIDQLMGVKGIVSIDIDKRIYRQLDVLRFNDPVYSYNFKNGLVPGSVLIEGIEVDSTTTNHKVYDDGNGVIKLSYDLSDSNTIVKDIGTVDYEEGSFDFSINMIQSKPQFTISAEPVEENVYVYNNKYTFIDKVGFETLTLNPKR